MTELNKNTFSCRLHNVFTTNTSKEFDQKDSTVISRLEDLVLKIGYYDPLLTYNGNITFVVSSVLYNIKYTEFSFDINTIGLHVVNMSNIISTNIASEFKYDFQGKKRYFFHERYINDKDKFYSVWKKIIDLSNTINNTTYDILKFECKIPSNNGVIVYENYIEYIPITSQFSGAIETLKSSIENPKQDTIEYSIYFDNGGRGFSTVELDYIKNKFKYYKYFLIIVDDYGNHQLLKSDIVFNIGQLVNNKIVTTFKYDIPDNIFIDSVILIATAKFSESSETVQIMYNKSILKHEKSYFNTKIKLYNDIGKISIGRNVTEQGTILSYLASYIPKNIKDLNDLRILYSKVDKLYGMKLIEYDIESTFIKIAFDKQYDYLLYFILLPIMKKSIGLWDNSVDLNVDKAYIQNNTFHWIYKNVPNNPKFLIQINYDGTWKTVESGSTQYSIDAVHYNFNIDRKYLTSQSNVYKIRVMQVETNGVWNYIPAKEISFVCDSQNNIISSDTWQLNYDYISVLNPFNWETLRDIFSIDWEYWAYIVKDNFINNPNYNKYKTLLEQYVYNNWDRYISYNKVIELNGVAQGMNLKVFKELNPYWKDIQPFDNTDDNDVIIAYSKFNLDGFPSIYARALFLYAQPYYYVNGEKQLVTVRSDGIKCVFYNKTFAETLNNLSMGSNPKFNFIKNSIGVTDEFCLYNNIHYYEDIISNPYNTNIGFIELSDELDGLFGSFEYNEYIKGESIFTLFFINKNIYNRHHIKIMLGSPTGVTLKDEYWQEYNEMPQNYTKKGFIEDETTGKTYITYWDGLSQSMKTKYAPINNNYIEIEQNDIDEFYKFTELVNINSLK